jgi:SNF2 family DNA or RNA helicase
MIIDESTTIKNKGAKRTKNLIKLGLDAKYKRILTGSPVTKSPLDLYSQCAFLDKSLLGFTSFLTFRNRYAVMRLIDMGGRAIEIPQYYTNSR